MKIKTIQSGWLDVYGEPCVHRGPLLYLPPLRAGHWSCLHEEQVAVVVAVLPVVVAVAIRDGKAVDDGFGAKIYIYVLCMKFVNPRKYL